MQPPTRKTHWRRWSIWSTRPWKVSTSKRAYRGKVPFSCWVCWQGFLYCWWLKSCTSWQVVYPIISIGFHTYQVVQDFFHQQYGHFVWFLFPLSCHLDFLPGLCSVAGKFTSSIECLGICICILYIYIIIDNMYIFIYIYTPLNRSRKKKENTKIGAGWSAFFTPEKFQMMGKKSRHFLLFEPMSRRWWVWCLPTRVWWKRNGLISRRSAFVLVSLRACLHRIPSVF